MFDDLTEKLSSALRALRRGGRLTPDEVAAALGEVRVALLEADVHLQVVRDFVERVRERAIGQEVLDSLQPGHQVVQIVHQELVKLLGERAADLDLYGHPAVVLLCGLQGSGKTTFAAKLARHFAKRGRKPLVVAADVQRPAAIEQLQVLCSAIDVPVWAEPGKTDVPGIVARGRDAARERLLDTLIVDTAGRLHVDEELMNELEAVGAVVPKAVTLLVVDAMTGQEAVRVAQAFDARLDLTGLVLT